MISVQKYEKLVLFVDCNSILSAINIKKNHYNSKTYRQLTTSTKYHTMSLYTLRIEALHKSTRSNEIQAQFISENKNSHFLILQSAIEIYIRKHHDSLHQNHKLELFESFTGFELTMDLLQNLEMEPLTLSKAELLISIYIENMQICDGVVNHVNIGISDVMSMVSEDEPEQFELKDTNLKIIIYENQDYEKDLIDEFDNITLNSAVGHNSLYDLSYISNELQKDTLDHLKMDIIPNSKFDHLWDSLKFSNGLKRNLLGHSMISINLSKKPLLINNCNKILLLYGPPGSGKTTLCKSIAQKISIQYGKGVFVEFQCSKIFSRFFGESCKNLEMIFKDFKKLIQSNPELIIVILIDEIETIASSRENLLKQNETNDGIRVVNTLLTQLDQLKPYDNFIILSTSNNLNALDNAFIDRCDEIFHIDKPNSQAVFQILKQSINELIHNKIIIHNELINEHDEIGSLILQISEQCVSKNYSGRFLTRLPMMILAKHSNHNDKDNHFTIPLLLFLKSLATKLLN